MILDGVGHRTDPRDNAVLAANTPNLDKLTATCPNGLISGSGMDVGLPDGQFGNSEVGHMNLGAGRILFQDSTRIMNDINTGDFLRMKLWSVLSKLPMRQKVRFIFWVCCQMVASMRTSIT